MININNVTQAYQKRKILDSVSLQVKKNERCALVGRNGAGKSTLIHTMLGVLAFKQGEIYLAEKSNKKGNWKKHVSYLPEKFQLYPNLTGWENMLFFAQLNGKVDKERIEKTLRNVSLWGDRDAQINGYSKGMLQRLGLAVVLYQNTEIIILDEPTSGLDPIGRREILSIIGKLTNKTVFMASHHIDEIKQVCTHVAFLEQGKITKYSVGEFLDVYEKVYV